MSVIGLSSLYFTNGYRVWLFLCLLLALSSILFSETIGHMVGAWLGMEEYSHGLLIPIISGFLVWQNKNELARLAFKPSLAGFLTLGIGLLLYFLGELSSLFIILQYAWLVVLFGIVWAALGTKAIKLLWVPLILFFFAIRLPNFVYQGLSAKLQLWSSALGVSFIRSCDIAVYQEGNVIDLGAMQLQVVEACSGLRYLFPLMSLAFICAYFYKVSFWKRAVVFLSSMPITILMNSFRIGVIGVTVEYFGKEAAEGFLHDFEGWAVFMACTGILLAEMWALARLGNDPRPLQEVFGLTFPEPFPPGTQFRERELPKQFWVVGAMLLAALGLSLSLEHRQEIVPARAEYVNFPLKMGDWVGRRQIMEQQYVDALKFDDYILADYVREQRAHPSPLPEGEGIRNAVTPEGVERTGVDPYPLPSPLPEGEGKNGSMLPDSPVRPPSGALSVTKSAPGVFITDVGNDHPLPSPLPEGEGIKSAAVPEGGGIKGVVLPEGEGIKSAAVPAGAGIEDVSRPEGEGIKSAAVPAGAGIEDVSRPEGVGIKSAVLPEGEGTKRSVAPVGEGTNRGARERGMQMPVNFYSAYYASQRKGESIHSPRSCIPGGGWQIVSHEVVSVDGVSLYGRPLQLNRLLIQKGEDRQLVYYWFQQRGRDLTNEYLVKWYLFWDALTLNRTDGALVRLTTFASKGEDIADADWRLQDFLKTVLPELDKYIPD